MRDELGPRERDLLLLLGRFGFITRPQAAAWLGTAPAGMNRARAALEGRGLIRRVRVVAGRGLGRPCLLELTAAGRAAVSSLPGAPPLASRPPLQRMDPVLASVDLALLLQREGLRWQVWSTGAEEGEKPPLPPTGILEGPDAGRTPVWVVLDRPRPGVLRASVDLLYRRLDLRPARIFCPAALAPWVEGLGTQAEVTVWEPPHLGRRAALAWSGRGIVQPRLLGPRMLDILTCLDRFGYALPTQLAAHLGMHAAGVRRSLSYLEGLGLAQHAPGSAAPRGRAWSATAQGLRTIGSPRQALDAQPMHGRHSLVLVDLALQLRTAGSWETERELAPAVGPGFGLDRITPPDARLTLPDGRRVLIQLQLSRGHIPEQYRNAWRQRERGLGEAVRFLCLPELAPAYRRARQPAEEDFIEVQEWVPPGW